MGQCIKRNREKRNISLADLAQKTGIDVAVLQLFENGKQKPKAKELEKIAGAIDTPMIALIHGGGILRSRRKDEEGHFVCRSEEY